MEGALDHEITEYTHIANEIKIYATDKRTIHIVYTKNNKKNGHKTIMISTSSSAIIIGINKFSEVLFLHKLLPSHTYTMT